MTQNDEFQTWKTAFNITIYVMLPLSSHRKWGGGRFGENVQFSKENIEIGLLFYMKIFRAARAAFIIS